MPATSLGSRVLALADSRLPTGAHAHSAGVEQAITRGLIREAATLEWFVARRLPTAGLVAAGAAAQSAVATSAADWAAIDAALDARTPTPAIREASRGQGRGLVRLAAQLGTPLPLLGPRPHHPVALGALLAQHGGTPAQAALLAVQLAATGMTAAAQRLLALDPFAVAAVVLRLAPTIDRVAAEGEAAAGQPPGVLPDLSDPLADLLASEHHARKDRFFVS